jgi:hypothetical protein
MASRKQSIAEYWKEHEAQNAADASKLTGKRQRNPSKRLRESDDVAPVEPAQMKKKSTGKTPKTTKATKAPRFRSRGKGNCSLVLYPLVYVISDTMQYYGG